MNEIQPALKQWANFYLTVSAASATLIGLLFVVIALISSGTVRNAAEGAGRIRVYLTPTVANIVTTFCGYVAGPVLL